MALDPRHVLVAGGGVGHDPVLALAEQVDDQVIDHPALLVEHARVQGLARLLELVDRIGEQPAQEVAGLRTGQVDDRHVADVEHPRRAPHVVVLLDLRPVIERHVPAAEIHHLRAQRAVGEI